MTKQRNLSEIELLEQYRIAFENVLSQAEIARVMAEFGYDAETIAIGKLKYEQCRAIYDFNKREDQETSDAYEVFETKRDKLIENYRLHRKKAKIIFRKEAGLLLKLQLHGNIPNSYLKFIEMMKVFYTALLEDESLQMAVAALNMGVEELTAARSMIGEVESARVSYLREEGESQDATKQKDASFNKIDDWMHDFYAVARIALEENPQLLEALGLFVRS